MKKRWLFLALALSLGGALVATIEDANVPPRQLASYLERRAAAPGAGDADRLATSIAASLYGAAGTDGNTAPALRWRIGAQAISSAAAVDGKTVQVATAAEGALAIAKARPGAIITFAPGTYRYSKMSAIEAGGAGGVTVRAARPGTVFLEFDMVKGIVVSAPHWTFENLSIRGVCAAHDRCEHAFHIVGGATGFVARNNTISDFNAHFKVNSFNGKHPDQGQIINNTLRNSSARDTAHPVTVIDIVGASSWTIRANVIADFIKAKGDTISYGAFAKGAGARNAFIGNAVLCEERLRGAAGQRVGLSFGNGGTGRSYCRDGRCITEQEGGVIEANLIASCSDEGIYLNRAATTSIRHNTLVDTAGIMLRYPETSADISGNILDGRIAASNGAVLRAGDNLETGVTRLFLGMHPQRALFRNPAALDFRWKEAAPRRSGANSVADLCGGLRNKAPVMGAFEDFAHCLRD